MRRCCSEDRICAEIVGTVATMVKISAWDTWRNRDAVPQPEILNLATYLGNRSRTLSSKDDWGLEGEVADPSLLPVVHITHADTCLSDLHDHIVRDLDLRPGYFFDRDALENSKHGRGI